ncbi:hypothetical protein Ddye_003297 [Dipteronia dyeriana]|uniref:Growth-regulating factor n=1 Tax=Dipteronia dyeriana TaxID=168575 RepID=A0AAE0CVV0_9ROSI|nr:hypothetical protein Ddye_003297 [Dipteronia dyeriana]
MDRQQYPPSKIARFADFGFGTTTTGGGGGGGWSDSWNMEETNGSLASSIGLGLELGSGSGTTNNNDNRAATSGYKTTKYSGFTIFQMQELHLQSLIYKYMEAGLPVPSDLVIPIWKSVASSFSGVTNGLHQYYPGMMGYGGGGLHVDLKNGMDLEPGRCRRTDGKKWRCSKEAVPDHKYCERHLHRGRPRSRKLVEAPSSSSATAIKSSTSSGGGGGDTNTNLTISLPALNI